MATMQCRFNTFKLAFESIINQVDKLYLYLDGYDDVPALVREYHHVTPILSKEIPDLHANGKFLGLAIENNECLYLSVDDDLQFPASFVESISTGLSRYGYKAVVGYHGSILSHPFNRYSKDRKVIVYDQSLMLPSEVDVLGTGAVMFFSKNFNFDIRDWTYTNMVDLGMAIEAAKLHLPLICLPRKKGFIQMLEKRQENSIFKKLLKDDTRQTDIARILIDLK